MAVASLRQTTAMVLAAVVLAVAALTPAPAHAPSDDRPNVIIILTDDQSFDTLPSNPPTMPWLQSQIQDPNGHWLWFPNAFIETPLCCPSRATILSGRYSRHTQVRTNDDGHRFDESNTLATWLHDGGYTTGLIGKYLNRYPFDRGPYIPPGWDRWVAKRSTAATTTYYDFGFVDQGVALQTSDSPATYATDLFADRAVDFLKTAPQDRPFFLYFATSAPHPPWTPPLRHVGAFADEPLSVPASVGERNVSDKPGWVQQLPPLDSTERAKLMADRRHEAATLLGVDDAVKRIFDQLSESDDLGNTVVFFLTDNGYSFGEHRIRGKRCPYEECIRTPFAVRVPGATAGDVPGLVSNVDLAPTIADLAGVDPSLTEDGRTFAPVLLGRPWKPPDGVFLEWAGDHDIPPWQGVRTTDFVYIEDADGTVELYDLTGVLGPADPLELKNRSGDHRYRRTVRQLARKLDAFRSRQPRQG
jgi:N-acetylglucosamine-6-sulfatase